MKRILVVATVLVLVLLGAGPILAAESGFRVDTHGFGFENYGNPRGIANMTPTEVVRLFGPAANARDGDGEISLVPAAQEWMEQTNAAMRIGHCEGMAVLSYLLFLGKADPGTFGGATANALELDGNVRLQREIAMWWATQLTDTTRSARMVGSPNELLQRLRDGLPKRDPECAYTLDIWKPDGSGGHAVTPYAVVDQDDTQARIMVYDNNFPNQERFISIDKEEDSWSYSTAQNPSEAENAYTGDATTRTLILVPCAVRLQRQQADFLGDAEYADDPGLDHPQPDALKPGDEAPDDDDEDDDKDEDDRDHAGAGSGSPGGSDHGAPLASATAPAKTYSVFQSSKSEKARTPKGKHFMELALTGPGAHLLITDANGKRTGWVQGKIVNEIPDAQVVRFMGGWRIPPADLEPRYRVPAAHDYIVSVVGTAEASETVTVSCLGRGTELVVEDISVEPGQVDQVFFSPDGTRVAYRPSGDEHPTLTAGYTSKGPDYEITAYGVETTPGATVELEIIPKVGAAKVQVLGSKEPATIAVEIERLDKKSTATYKNDDLKLDPGDAAYLHFAAWQGGKTPIAVNLDKGGEGRLDAEVELANENE